MTAEDLPYPLTSMITIGIMRDPARPKGLLKITVERPRSGSEVLGNDELDQLLACIVTAKRAQKRKHYPNSRKFHGSIPETIWLGPDVKMLMGRLERAFKEGREKMEE